MIDYKNRWTSDEDSTLIAQVRAYPQNLRQAFQNASEKLGRTKSACAQRWYTKLSHSYKENPKNICFTMFSKKHYGVNRKNLTQETTVAANKSIWRVIINFISKLK